MSDFDEKLIKRLTKLEREVERLKVKESPIMSNYLLTTGKAADSDKLDGNDSTYFAPASSVVTDHGALSGLGDNDHPQYLLTTGKAADADKLDNIDSTGFVQTTGNQSVGGIKTFTSIPVLPASNPTTANQAVRKGYADGTYLGITGKAADSDKLDGKTLAQVMLSIYPVGAIFTSSNSTDPGTLFGGTWEAYGAGRVLVGKASSGTFATAGATGGSETHTLTVAQMPSHTHTQDPHSHTIPSAESGADFATTRPGGYGNTLTTSSTTATNQNTGGGEAHNNLQPYIVVYMWRRTA